MKIEFDFQSGRAAFAQPPNPSPASDIALWFLILLAAEPTRRL